MILQPIWTLDARGNVILEVASDHFDLTSSQIRSTITASHQSLLAILQAKGINYNGLRAALVPQRTRLEYVFAFEIEKIQSSHYGASAGEQLLAALNRNLTCSILTGQLNHPDKDVALALLDRYMQKHRPSHLTDVAQLYCIYLNNLTQVMVDRIHSALVNYEPYVGSIPVSFSSPIKTWLSFRLGRSYFKLKGRMLSAHEDDVSNDENYNLPCWPVERFNYQYASLQSIYFHLFLSYKIERAVYPAFEVDTRFSLNAISDSPLPLHDLSVEIADGKLRYLQGGKAGTLAIAGIGDLTIPRLRDLITSKLRHNYIYNLRFDEEHDVSLFNIILEVVNPERPSPVKLMAALAYQPERKLLRLITLF